MRVIKIPSTSVLGPGPVNPESDRVKRFVEGLKTLAGRFDGRLNVEFEETTILVSIRSDAVFTGVSDFLRKRGIEPVEVDLLDEFFPPAADKAI